MRGQEMVCYYKDEELNRMLSELTRKQEVVKKQIRSWRAANISMDPQSSGTKNNNARKGYKDLWFTLSDSEDSNSTDQILQDIRPPDQFICPLTNQVMTDPVILSSGKTVERKSIEAYFEVHPTCTVCPVTKTESLSSHELIPDDLLRTEIESWQEIISINNERRHSFKMLLSKLAYPGEDQLASATELRALVHDFPSLANYFSDMGSSAVLELARPLLSMESDITESLREDIIVTFRILAKHNKNTRKFIMNHRNVVSIISDSMRSGSLETRRSAVTLVRYITVDPVNRHVLKQLGVIEHLVEIVDEGDLLLLYDAVLALFRLLKFGSRRVIGGVLTAVLNNLSNEDQIGNIDRLLNMVMKDKVVWKHVAESDIMHQELLALLMDNSKSDAVKAFSVSTLLRIVRSSHTALLAVTTMVHEEEKEVISQIFEEGTSEAKEDAMKLLRLLNGEKLDETSAMEVHQNSLASADDLTAAAELPQNNLLSVTVSVMDAYMPDIMEGTEIHYKELNSNPADDHLILIEAPTHQNELKSADAMEGNVLNYNELFDLLDETESGQVMEVWTEALLWQIERSEAALIATWKREKEFRTITRVQALGNSNAWWVADEIFKWLDTVNPDQIQPDS